jgi:predicted transcriptional regulator
MARTRSAGLTDGELRLMRVLWDRGRATVGEVVEGVVGLPTPAYNTVLTMLRILERKGYVMHEKAGRAFVYSPLLDRGQARRRALSHLLERFFDDSAELLVLNLLEHHDMNTRERQRVRDLIEKSGSAHRGG